MPQDVATLVHLPHYCIGPLDTAGERGREGRRGRGDGGKAEREGGEGGRGSKGEREKVRYYREEKKEEEGRMVVKKVAHVKFDSTSNDIKTDTPQLSN